MPNRTQFKHILFAPALWSAYEPSFFPAVHDTIEAGDWALASKMVDNAAKILRSAAESLLA